MDVLNYPGFPGVFLAVLFSGALKVDFYVILLYDLGTDSKSCKFVPFFQFDVI